jgi:hypothetical protein
MPEASERLLTLKSDDVFLLGFGDLPESSWGAQTCSGGIAERVLDRFRRVPELSGKLPGQWYSARRLLRIERCLI